MAALTCHDKQHCGTAKPKQEQCSADLEAAEVCASHPAAAKKSDEIGNPGMTVSTLVHPFALRLASSKCVESTLTKAEKPIITIII